MTNVLTPQEIWKNFKVEKNINFEIIEEKTEGDIIISRIYIYANRGENGQTKIYGVLARNVQISLAPALLIMQNLSQSVDEDFCVQMAQKGYQVLMIDLAGKKEGLDYYTIYPENLCYANYENAKNNLIINADDVQNTCWYEWGVVGKYAFNFLKNRPFVTKTGVIAMRDACFSLWQVAGWEKDVACAVFLFNAGWTAYRGNFKFSNQPDLELTDNMLGYLAGVEPQAYAKHVKCPTLILTSTNSRKYDTDRAYDTKTRIAGYSAIDYSVNRSGSINAEAYADMNIFLDEFLMKGNNHSRFPDDLEIKASIDKKKIKVEVEFDTRDIEEVWLYSAEEEINPTLRCWKRTDKFISSKEGKYIFEYIPYCKSKIAFFFAKAKYKNGFTISSNIIAKRFEESEVEQNGVVNVLYSSRQEHSESAFTVRPKKFGVFNYVDNADRAEVEVEKGPMNINGVHSQDGISSFLVNISKYKPRESAMLMMDVFVPQNSMLEVKLVADYLDCPIVYTARVKVMSGNVWHNVKIEKNKFKTEEGKTLQSYQTIQFMEINVDGEYLINNILWV